MKCEKLICDEDSAIKEVMTCIENNTKGIAFIVDKDKRLVGIATDGDIRRALLEGAGLKESIKKHMNDEFVYALNPVDAQKIFQKYDWKLKVIPLVDEEMHIIDYTEYDNKRHISLVQPQLNGNEYNYSYFAY